MFQILQLAIRQFRRDQRRSQVCISLEKCHGRMRSWYTVDVVGEHTYCEGDWIHDGACLKNINTLSSRWGDRYRAVLWRTAIKQTWPSHDVPAQRTGWMESSHIFAPRCFCGPQKREILFLMMTRLDQILSNLDRLSLLYLEMNSTHTILPHFKCEHTHYL